jgi:hypothetical protein
MAKDCRRIQRQLQYGYPEPEFKDKDGNVLFLGHKPRKQDGKRPAALIVEELRHVSRLGI